MTWVAYRDKRGGFNVGMRMEVEFAQLRALVMNALRGKNDAPVMASDLLQHGDPISLEAAMKNWR